MTENYSEEIASIEALLNEHQVEPNENLRKSLAREIALIHLLDSKEAFNFSNLVQNDSGRQAIKDCILERAFELPLQTDDATVRMGVGGCRPRHRVKAERQAMILLGLPASGKSTVAQVMSDMRGAYLIDSDIAKRKFPEFRFPNGATWVHEESDQVAFNDTHGVFGACLEEDYNLVIPKLGSSMASIIELHQTLVSEDYETTLGYVELPRVKAVQRAISRYQTSKRYVPIHDILNKADPKITYNELKHRFDHHLHLSSDVAKHAYYNIEEISPNCLWW